MVKMLLRKAPCLDFKIELCVTITIQPFLTYKKGHFIWSNPFGENPEEVESFSFGQ